MRNLLEETIKEIEEYGHTIHEVKFVTDGDVYCNWEDFARNTKNYNYEVKVMLQKGINNKVNSEINQLFDKMESLINEVSKLKEEIETIKIKNEEMLKSSKNFRKTIKKESD